MHEAVYGKYNRIFAHAQTVCTRPLLGEGAGDEAIPVHEQKRKGLAFSVPPTTVLVCGGRPVRYKNPFKSFMDCHVMSHDSVDIPPRSFSPGSPCGPQLDVQRSDASLLALHGHILGSQHGSIGGSLVSISLHLHAPCHTSYCLPAREENLNSYMYCQHN